MGCGGTKESTDAAAAQKPTPSRPSGPPSEDPKAKLEDPKAEFDEDLDREVTQVRYDKKGQQKGSNAKTEEEKDPKSETVGGMFEVEEAGAGDQALAVKPWLGAICPPTNAPQVSSSPPSTNLTLEYVYGYRCFDTRQNIFFTSNPSEIVYMAAAVGINLNTASNSQKFMGGGEERQAKGHGDDITALAICPNRQYVATGETGKNPKIIVWNASTCAIEAEFRAGRGSRQITSLAFSSDGTQLVSTAKDNDHMVKVWQWKAGKCIFEAKGGPDQIFDCAWSPTANTFVTVGIKHIYFWFGDNGFDKKRGIFGSAGKMVNMTTCQWLSNGKAVTGGTNGLLYVWEENNLAKTHSVHAKNGANHTLRITEDKILAGGADYKLHVLDSEFNITTSHDVGSIPRACDLLGDKIIVGCRDGTIYEIEGENKKAVMESHCDGEVWGLDVSSDNPNMFVTVGDDNKLKVWDCSQKKCMNTIELEAKAGPKRKAGEGASTLAYNSPNQQARAVSINKSNGAVCVGFNDGHFNVYSGLAHLDSVVATGKDPKEWIETIRFSPDGKWLAIGSHDNGIYIYDASTYSLKDKGNKHHSYITALDWSCDSTHLHTTSGDYELLFWDVNASGKITQDPNGASGLCDEEWATFSTPFGWPVQGIFGGVIDYTHINRVARSRDSSVFAVGNDWGNVALWANPNNESSDSKSFTGHSEHVTNVKWTMKDTFLLSTGGYDQCVFQWRKG